MSGKYCEMSAMMQYLFQGWNCRTENKSRVLTLDFLLITLPNKIKCT
nr:manganese catalase family protein [Jeotgalibacillus sp. R-1-5s-1]